VCLADRFHIAADRKVYLVESFFTQLLIDSYRFCLHTSSNTKVYLADFVFKQLCVHTTCDRNMSLASGLHTD
jgi:hypothetical protein